MHKDSRAPERGGGGCWFSNDGFVGLSTNFPPSASTVGVAKRKHSCKGPPFPYIWPLHPKRTPLDAKQKDKNNFDEVRIFCSNKICLYISFDGYELEFCVHPIVKLPPVSKHSSTAYSRYVTAPWSAGTLLPLLPATGPRRATNCCPWATTDLSRSRRIFASAVRQHRQHFEKLLSAFVQRCRCREVARIELSLSHR